MPRRSEAKAGQIFTMTNNSSPALTKWPFLAGGVLLLAVAGFFIQQNHHSLSLAQEMVVIAAVALGAVLAVVPFVLEYQAAVKFTETDKLTDAVAQIQKLDKLAAQIGGATAQWQDVQTASAKTAAAAKEISEKMAAEIKEFTEFLKKANDTEKSALRLEVDKARRAEGEWLQVLVRILDHIFALNQAAAQSGQPELAAQISSFQNACRDVARRIGLTPFVAESGETFDDKRHKVLDSETAVADAAIVATLAPGYTFQGQLLRPALVKLQTGEAPKSEIAEAAEPTLL